MHYLSIIAFTATNPNINKDYIHNCIINKNYSISYLMAENWERYINKSAT